jgi:hypothetical protein
MSARGWIAGALLLLAAPVAAQNPPAAQAPAAADTARPAADTAARAADTTRGAPAAAVRQTQGDSVRPVPPITPMGAFFRSFILPGWGQARLHRNVTGGLFVLWEGVCAAMAWKAEWQLRYARTRNKFVRSHTQEREDWLVLLAFNHLFAGLEAYVSANLYDFPGSLKVRRLPDGALGVGVEIPVR